MELIFTMQIIMTISNTSHLIVKLKQNTPVEIEYTDDEFLITFIIISKVLFISHTLTQEIKQICSTLNGHIDHVCQGNMKYCYKQI